MPKIWMSSSSRLTSRPTEQLPTLHSQSKSLPIPAHRGQKVRRGCHCQNLTRQIRLSAKTAAAAQQQQSEEQPPEVSRGSLQDMFFPSASTVLESPLTASGSRTKSATARSSAQKPKFHRRRVEVGTKPLIVREGAELDSEYVGQLLPGQHARVLKARELADGSIRALVELVDELEATRKVLQSWWQPPGESVENSEMQLESFALQSGRNNSLSSRPLLRQRC